LTSNVSISCFLSGRALPERCFFFKTLMSADWLWSLDWHWWCYFF